MNKFLCVVVFSMIVVNQVECFNLTSTTKLFSAALYPQIVKSENENVCFSPLSAEIALSLLYVGARGDTATEIKRALQIPNSANKIEDAFQNFFNSITSTEDLSLHSANKMFIKKNLKIKSDFINITQKAFQANVENINFDDITKASQIINQWVEAQTQNKIRNLIDPTSLRSDTVALLINALYLKAKWSHEFDKSETTKVKFYKNNNETIDVDGMSFFLNEKSFKYAENEALDAKILELGFGTQSISNSMVVILPNKKHNLRKIEENLDIALTTILEEHTVEIMLPKFKVETHLDLKGILQNLGIHKAFTNGEADFSGIFKQKEDIYLDDAVQKSYINIDEGGVEAAAATMISAIPPSLSPPPTKSFIVDHPFLFYIQVKNVIIFMGKIVDPSV